MPSGWGDFDMAFSHEVLYLLGDLPAHAAGLLAALKPGGSYFAVVGVHAGSPLMSAWHAGNGRRTGPSAALRPRRRGRCLREHWVLRIGGQFEARFRPGIGTSARTRSSGGSPRLVGLLRPAEDPVAVHPAVTPTMERLAANPLSQKRLAHPLQFQCLSGRAPFDPAAPSLTVRLGFSGVPWTSPSRSKDRPLA